MINYVQSYDDTSRFYNKSKVTFRIASKCREIFIRSLALDVIKHIYHQINSSGNGQDFLRRVLGALNIRYEIDEVGLSNIPSQGPIVVVANHPFGGIEGIVLATLLGKVRGDLKIMANHLLACLPELHDLMIEFQGTEIGLAFSAESQKAPDHVGSPAACLQSLFCMTHGISAIGQKD